MMYTSLFTSDSAALTSTGEFVLQQHQVDGTRAARCPISLDDADVGAATIIPGTRVFAWKQASGKSSNSYSSASAAPSVLTVLSHVQLVHSVDVAQVGDASLDLGASLSCRLIDAFDHLLLFVNPVQVAAKHRQPHRLQDVGVGDHNPIGSCCFKQ